MTAMSGPRLLKRRESVNSTPPVKASTTIYQGALVVMDSGLAVPGKTGTGLIALGMAEETVANTGANGAANVTVERGTFRFENSAAADAITAADIGKQCFIVDDQTVAKTNGGDPATRSVAGTVIDLDGSGVFVRIG